MKKRSGEPSTGWPRPSREITLCRNAASRRTTCVGPDALAALRLDAWFVLDRFGGGSTPWARGYVEQVVAADDAGHALIAKERNRRRAAELFRWAAGHLAQNHTTKYRTKGNDT